ncbi:DUF6221 family protein, partial [Bacillus cereus]|uniref:DUF6221 family protein n=1 Tax=Bacillus cereus TaxID=1396 RepID=UPI0035FF1577
RALREVAAKRKIINDHRADKWYVYTDDDTRACETCGDSTVQWPCDTIRATASVYADHRDYNKEWALVRPDAEELLARLQPLRRCK